MILRLFVFGSNNLIPMCWGYFFRFMHLRYTQQIRNVTKETGNLRTVTEAFLVHIMCDWKPDNHIMAIPISLKSLILSHFFSWHHSMGKWEFHYQLIPEPSSTLNLCSHWRWKETSPQNFLRISVFHGVSVYLILPIQEEILWETPKASISPGTSGSGEIPTSLESFQV